MYNIVKRPDEEKITLIKKEQKKLHGIDIYRTIIFYEDPQARENYGIKEIGSKELLFFIF